MYNFTHLYEFLLYYEWYVALTGFWCEFLYKCIIYWRRWIKKYNRKLKEIFLVYRLCLCVCICKEEYEWCRRKRMQRWFSHFIFLLHIHIILWNVCYLNEKKKIFFQYFAVNDEERWCILVKMIICEFYKMTIKCTTTSPLFSASQFLSSYLLLTSTIIIIVSSSVVLLM